MSQDARRILDDFLNRIERLPDRTRRVTTRAPETFGSLADREAFEMAMLDAQRLGAVEVEYGKRDARHLIERIVLKDHMPLYELLGREPLAVRVAREVVAMAAAFPSPLPEIAAVIAEIEAGWAAARQPYGFAVGDPGVGHFIRALDAILRRDPADRSDLRTFSRKFAGNSKVMEENRSPISIWFRRSGRVRPDLGDAEVFMALGLEKFTHPVLIAGPIAVGHADIVSLPYVGLPPEALAELRPTGPVRSVLSIENLASFNRHVREVRREDDVVIFTGGFPSHAVLQALGTAFSWCPGACHHWGDIDPSGVGIALHIARSTGADLRPHLMDVTLASAHGTAATAASVPWAEGTPFADLAAFLASPDARHVEQEEIDPVAPSVSCQLSISPLA